MFFFEENSYDILLNKTTLLFFVQSISLSQKKFKGKLKNQSCFKKRSVKKRFFCWKNSKKMKTPEKQNRKNRKKEKHNKRKRISRTSEK